MLPQEESLNVLTEFLLQHSYHKVQTVPTDAIRKLARIVLTENVFIYEFMWKWGKELVRRHEASHEIYGR
jgi:hypothetical protein